MPVQVITSPPFGGKGIYARAEVERREEEGGELGLIVLDWSRLFGAMFVGAQSAYRDEAVADTGALRATGAVFDFIVGAVAARELSGFVLSQSPRQALALADRLDAPLLEVVEDVGVVADRVDDHVAKLRRTVARAVRSETIPRCRRAATAYYREQEQLVGRAREVRRSGGGYKVGEVKRPFDRSLWLRGLTPRGKEAVAQLKDLGNDLPDPAAVMSYLLRNKVEV